MLVYKHVLNFCQGNIDRHLMTIASWIAGLRCRSNNFGQLTVTSVTYVHYYRKFRYRRVFLKKKKKPMIYAHYLYGGKNTEVFAYKCPFTVKMTHRIY